ncbi:hypothetical protein [Methylobacterium sp. AMS5]|uniref:hypothetical protein n=1 Tax=Methylobacterium sp. AMS5 TaxID=925818 RepID=UPI0011876BA7|nr:hypothetical protein [Methylobacterium sp. AMS5]
MPCTVDHRRFIPAASSTTDFGIWHASVDGRKHGPAAAKKPPTQHPNGSSDAIRLSSFGVLGGVSANRRRSVAFPQSAA